MTFGLGLIREKLLTGSSRAFLIKLEEKIYDSHLQ